MFVEKRVVLRDHHGTNIRNLLHAMQEIFLQTQKKIAIPQAGRRSEQAIRSYRRFVLNSF
jgi:hypothetical protein